MNTAPATAETDHTNPDPLLTAPEVAAYLNVSVSFVHQRIADGTLAARRFGRAVRVPLSVVRAYAEGAR